MSLRVQSSIFDHVRQSSRAPAQATSLPSLLRHATRLIARLPNSRPTVAARPRIRISNSSRHLPPHLAQTPGAPTRGSDSGQFGDSLYCFGARDAVECVVARERAWCVAVALRGDTRSTVARDVSTIYELLHSCAVAVDIHNPCCHASCASAP